MVTDLAPLIYTESNVRFPLEKAGITPTPTLITALLHPAKQKIAIGGWRGGKSNYGAAQLFLACWHHFRASLIDPEHKALFWIVGPDYTQTIQEMTYLIQWSQKCALYISHSENQEGSRTLNLRGGITVVTKSAVAEERLGSVAPDIILVCEAGQISETARDMIDGRAMEKNAAIIYTGTMEDDEGHAAWAWYLDSAMEWLDHPTSRHAAFSFPSWENPVIFGDCTRFIEDDPPLAQFCPDENHGPSHSGRLHPLIHERELKYDPFTFARKIAAIPSGTPFQVYPGLTHKRSELLRPLTKEEELLPIVGGYGGIDYGTVHPSSITACQIIPDPRDSAMSYSGPKGIMVVRENWWSGTIDPGNRDTLLSQHQTISRRWRIWNWMTDPNERFMAKSFEGVTASYSLIARESRVGLLNTRIQLGKIIFDPRGPGVEALYDEAEKVHRRKQRDGQMVYLRMNDDRTASLEDATELCDGQPRLPSPSAIGRRSYSRPRSRRSRRTM